MMLTTRLSIAFFMGFSTFCSAQIDRYTYKSELNGVTNTWHKIIVPNTVFGKVKSDFSDIRIYGITPKNDTIEAPYVFNILSEKLINTKIAFNIINTTKSEKGTYFTLQLDTEGSINEINLNFATQNFDWKLDLEGSQNQQDWFTVLEDYRILSIKNTTTDFKFTKLVFNDAKYRFFRVLIKDESDPKFSSAQLLSRSIIAGNGVDYSIKSSTISEDKNNRQTVINLELNDAVPLSHLDMSVSQTFDYYRPLKIEYRSDSTQTEKGVRYQYKTIANGILNSLEANSFKLFNTIAKHLRITVFNGDNQPLTITGFNVKGYEHQLTARFTKNADYILVYGNELDRQPSYDIKKFVTKIPKELTALTVKNEIEITKTKVRKIAPLFENDFWLWGIIGVVILVLGGFTLKMLKKA
ncbi:MAG: DUF3999 family protein [Winogradskyella sp.]